ncbi:SMC5-SMC6 complex localization factor protein 2 isoform X2 [Sardina pilchardus]|uniref:SMC5-SMC6 complex localization factor protein 2 isoform X2 n=1 Tax=Sardina pilchardus TaxID=27697 RepID=UPI002E109677
MSMDKTREFQIRKFHIERFWHLFVMNPCNRISSSLKQHIISMVKDIIPLGTQRRTSADDGSQHIALSKPEARSRSRGPTPSLLTPCPTRSADPTPPEESNSRSRMGPPFTRKASQSDGNMSLRSSVNRLSRSARRSTLTPDPKKQHSPTAIKRVPVMMGPSRNTSSERKSSEASPRKSSTVPARKLSFVSPKKDLQKASGSKTDQTPSHMETLQKMLRDGRIQQPRICLKRLRECDIESLHEVKRPCLNDDQQAHVQTHKPVNPGRKDTLSPPLTPSKTVCTSSNSTSPQKTKEPSISANSTQPECTLTHTSTDVTASTQPKRISTNACTNATQSEDKQAHTPITANSECKLTHSCADPTQSETKPEFTSKKSTQPDTTPSHTPTDSVQSKQTATSANKSQPTSKPTYASADTTKPASVMAHRTTNVTHPSSRPIPRPVHSPSRPYPNQEHPPRPLQPSHTFAQSTLSTSRQTIVVPRRTQADPRVTFGPTHPGANSTSGRMHTPRPRPLLPSPTLVPLLPRGSAPAFQTPMHSLTPRGALRHPSSTSHMHSQHTHPPSIYSRPFTPGNARVASNPGPRANPAPRACFNLTPLNSNSHAPLRPVPKLVRLQMQSSNSTPTNSVSKPTHGQTPGNAVTKPSITITKLMSTLTKTSTPTSTSAATGSHTPMKPVAALNKTPITTYTVSGATDSLTPAKPTSAFAKPPVTNSVSRPTESPTPKRPVSLPTNPLPAPRNATPNPAYTRPPIHPFFQPRQRTGPPLRHPAPSPPRLPDAKQPCVSSPFPATNRDTPPKYVQRAFMRRSQEGTVMLRGKCSPRVLLSEPSPSSSSSASSSSSLAATTVKSSARKLFPEADSQLAPTRQTSVSSGPLSSPVDPLKPFPTLSETGPPASGPFQTPRSPSPLMDNLDEILTPDSLPTSTGMDIDMASPEASQGSPSHSPSPSPSHTGTLLAQLDETDMVLDEPGIQNPDIRALKVEPDTNPSKVCTNQDSFSMPQVLPRRPSPAGSPEVVWLDPLEDDLGFDAGLDCALSDTSSSEDEKLLSLQEIMERSARPPPTPDKDAFPEPSTPVAAKAPVELIKVKPVRYHNTLDEMLIERNRNQKSKELEEKLLQGCREDLLMEEEVEEAEKDEEDISQEQHNFVQRYTLTASTIRDLHPGEELFSLASFGRLFTQDNLHLPQGITPKNTAQRCLFRASPNQALLLVRAGLLKTAYAASPCQPEISRWLLQMMSVHSNPCMSAQILHSLKHLALIAGLKIESQDPKFQVWVPSMQDVVLVFLNMGVPFISMFPLEMLQPTFTEADLLGSTVIGPEGVSSGSEHASFPEHNFDNVIKYLSVCAALCPRAYSDRELVLLLTLVCLLSLDTHLQLLPTANLSNLMLHLINNITDWDTQMPLVCRALTDLTDDHHNLRRLVQLLPPNNRGRQLRRHLSLSIISKLLNQRCTYKPVSTEFKLSELRRYVPHMTPSQLKKKHMAKRPDLKQDEAVQDQQAYYLCYSLLDLTNEASNYEFLHQDQKNQLKHLSAQLEKHVKCDIRESEKCLYRSKVKDYVARIYTRWQVLLQRTRPAQGKLYDFWEPLSEDALSGSQEEQQDLRRPQLQQEVQQEQRRSPLQEEVQQEQRRSPLQEEAQQEQQKGKENVAQEPKENVALEEPEVTGEEEMGEESSGDETVIEDETVMEEQPEEVEKEGNGEKSLSKQEPDKAEGPPTGEEGLSVQEEGVHAEQETDKKERLETQEGVDKVEVQPTEGEGSPVQGNEEPEKRGELPLKEGEELAMEEESTREDGLPAKEARAEEDKMPVMEESTSTEEHLEKQTEMEESTSTEEHLEKQAEMEEVEMEVEVPEEQEQEMEAGEQAASSREGVDVEEMEMKETQTESPKNNGPDTEEPMSEVETAEGERSVGEGKPGLESGEKTLDAGVSKSQVMDEDTHRGSGEMRGTCSLT